ncbi:hypothetical protein BU17DRAFT_81439 [Hysterangium stoloniferum]|nr:hypothetical protein BU17DRAFT_81439 [Hysterangium stoloniferum]
MGITQLPPELLYQIIREATVPTELLHGIGYDPIPAPGSQLLPDQPPSTPSLEHSHTLLHKSFTDKVHISLVCRLWRDITIRFMYDFVIVRKALHIPFLLKRLSQPHIDISRILRLDFLCLVGTKGICLGNKFYPIRRLARAVGKLISLSTNLRVFSFKGDLFREDFFPVAGALLKATTLEYLEWCSSYNLPLVWYLLKPQSPRLRSFHFTFINARVPFTHHLCVYGGYQAQDSVACTSDHDESSDDFDFTREELENMTSLYESETGDQGRLTDIGDDELINLNLYPTKHITFGHSSDVQRFLRYPNILLQINTLTFGSNTFHSYSHALHSFPANIHTVIFHLEDVPMIMEGVSRAKRLGLKGTELPPPAEFDSHFTMFTGCGSSGTIFPNLELIQFMDAALAREIEKRPLQLRLWAHRCQSGGISLRDETGRAMGTT